MDDKLTSQIKVIGGGEEEQETEPQAENCMKEI